MISELKIGGNLTGENFGPQSDISLDILSVNDALKFLNTDEPQVKKKTNNISPDKNVVCVSLLDDCEVADDLSPPPKDLLLVESTVDGTTATGTPGIELESNLPE